MTLKTKLYIYGTLHTLVMTFFVVMASLERSVLDNGHLMADVWFLGTLADTYMAFLLLALWALYKERRVAWQVFWVLAFAFLGNIAIGIFILRATSKLSATSGLRTFLGDRFDD
jgi:hypothetical protein